MTELAIRLAIVLGVSRGELVALRWSDVDLDAHTVSPSRRFDDAAEACGLRTPVAIDAATFLLLEDVHSRRLDGGEWVISSDSGRTPWTPGHLSNRWALVRARVPGAGAIRLDDLRDRGGPRRGGPGRGPARPERRTEPLTGHRIQDEEVCPACWQPLMGTAAGMVPGRAAAAALRRCLTKGEDAVAMLAALGKSNSAIAAELFVSVKAVEFHLTHVFQKFGILNRTQLSLLFGPASVIDRGPAG
jgi:DNA-binding CsgD family transcriptional regulator